jgi:oligoribonuclease
MVDVWTVGELARRWYPDVAAGVASARAGARAIDEARESIEELRFYRTHLLAARESAPS